MLGATSESAKLIWARPGYREKMAKMRNNSEYQEKHSKACKEKWADPEHREKITQAILKTSRTPERKKKRSEAMKKLWNDPEHREKVSQASKEVWTNPEHREKMAKIQQNPEFREKQSKGMKKLWNDPEHRERMSGENSHLWKGGTARLPYTYEFIKLRPEIIKRDNFTCQKCKITETELNYSLSVHHIDYNRDNNVESNLVSLCRSCHAKTNHDRDYWEAFLTTLIEQKEPLKSPIMGMEPLSQDPTYSIIGGINDGY